VCIGKCRPINAGGSKPHLIAINDNSLHESSNIFRQLLEIDE
jgi:hypothetical protein